MPPERRMTEAEMRRKTNKPIMEKKRRERINKCLEDLKTIVLAAVSEDSRPNKLEKADILEMTVRYLKSVKSGKPLPMDFLPDGNSSQKSGDVESNGYAQCVKDISHFLNKNEGVSVTLRTQLLGHLADKCNPVKESNPTKRQRERISTFGGPNAAHFSQHMLTELDLRNQHRLDESASANFVRAVTFPHMQGADISGDGGQRGMSLSSPVARHSDSRFSPVPVSPISDASTSSPSPCRPIPSPSLSSSSQHSEDSMGDVVSNSPDSFLRCAAAVDRSLISPITPRIDYKPRGFAEGVHLHYVSSDSGHWSSGSNPPSPINAAPKSKDLSKSHFNRRRDVKSDVKLESTRPSAMWRPWGL